MATTDKGIWTPDGGDGYALTVNLMAMADTIDDAIGEHERLRLTGTAEASLSSTDHPLQVGPTGGANLVADGNEVQARNNGAPGTISLNPEGGPVVIGNAGSTVSIPGHATGPSTPYAIAAGKIIFSHPANTAAVANITVTLPAGRFSLAPIVSVSLSGGPNGAQKCSARTHGGGSASSFLVGVWQGDASGVNIAHSDAVDWIAVQMGSGSSAG